MAQTDQKRLAPNSSQIDQSTWSDRTNSRRRGTASGVFGMTLAGVFLACTAMTPVPALAGDETVADKASAHSAASTQDASSLATPTSFQSDIGRNSAPYGLDSDTAAGTRRYDVPAARRTIRNSNGSTIGNTAGDNAGYVSAYGISERSIRRDAPISLTGGGFDRYRSVNGVPTPSHRVYGTGGGGHSAYSGRPLGATRFTAGTDRPGNVVQRSVSSLFGWLDGSSGKRLKNSSLDSSFVDLEDYQDLYAKAAGWNGDRYFQYQLGQMFEAGDGVVAKNEAAAYLWYSLAAAQNLDIAQQKRQRLLARKLNGGRADRATKLEVYHKFIELYIFGGAEGAYRLGEILESTFFQGRHDQDEIDSEMSAPKRRLIHAYAAYTLALALGHPDAERARLVLTQRENLTQYDSIEGEEIAEQWTTWIGMSEDGVSPFVFSTKQTKQALSRGSDYQYRRGDTRKLKDKARSLLSSGRAYKALGDVRNAKIAFEAAIALDPASTAAQEANEELVALTTTCSAARPEAPGNPLGKIWQVSIAEQQRALKALGYYDGYIDNVPGPATRAGIRRFLQSLNADVNDFLNSEQVVELVCNSAQVRGNPSSQNMLGVMYAEGIGVVRNVQLAQHWFGKAAQQGDPSAKYNLGRMYAREVGVSIPGHPQNCEIARTYLRESYEAGHPDAGRELDGLSRTQACRQISRRSSASRGG